MTRRAVATKAAPSPPSIPPKTGRHRLERSCPSHLPCRAGRLHPQRQDWVAERQHRNRILHRKRTPPRRSRRTGNPRTLAHQDHLAPQPRRDARGGSLAHTVQPRRVRAPAKQDPQGQPKQHPQPGPLSCRSRRHRGSFRSHKYLALNSRGHLRKSLRLLVVLGHSGCDALTAAVDAFLDPGGYLEIATNEQFRSIVDRHLIAVQASARALAWAYGSDVMDRPGIGRPSSRRRSRRMRLWRRIRYRRNYMAEVFWGWRRCTEWFCWKRIRSGRLKPAQGDLAIHLGIWPGSANSRIPC
jgi:hypothetical protein